MELKVIRNNIIFYTYFLLLILNGIERKNMCIRIMIIHILLILNGIESKKSKSRPKERGGMTC